MIVAGIDPSLTGTGIATIDLANPDESIATKIIGSAPNGNDINRRYNRLTTQAALIHQATKGAALVVIEAPTMSGYRQTGVLETHGLWWYLIDVLLSNSKKVALVPPSSRAKYATGKGNAAKDQVLLAVARRYINAEPKDNNEADALILAAMGARYLGKPIEESLPKAHLDAMDGAQWPDLEFWMTR